MLILLDNIEKFTEEMDVAGIHQDALPDSIAKYNAVLEWAKQMDAENPVWTILTPIDVSETSASLLALSCRALSDVLRENLRKAAPPAVWSIDEETVLEGAYEGIVRVNKGQTFTLNGSVIGKVIVEDGATFICNGYLKGDVEKSPQGVFVYEGKVSGNVRTVKPDERQGSSTVPIDDEL